MQPRTRCSSVRSAADSGGSLRARRAELGLPASDDSALLVDAKTGQAVGVQALPLHLRKARLTRVNTEANGSVCRGMLSHRYATRGEGQLEEIT